MSSFLDGIDALICVVDDQNAALRRGDLAAAHTATADITAAWLRVEAQLAREGLLEALPQMKRLAESLDRNATLLLAARYGLGNAHREAGVGYAADGAAMLRSRKEKSSSPR